MLFLFLLSSQLNCSIRRMLLCKVASVHDLVVCFLNGGYPGRK